MENRSDYITLEEAAKELGINLIQLFRYIQDKFVRSEKINGEYYLSMKELEKIKETLKPESKKPAPLMKIDNIEDKAPLRRRISSLSPHQISSEPSIDPIIRTLVELGIEDIDQVKNLIAQHASDCLSLVDNIENEGISDVNVLIDLLVLDQAIKSLTVRRELYKRLYEGTTLILLPLPPHLSDTFLRVAVNDLVLVTDTYLPPHLKRLNYRHVDKIPVMDLEKLVEGVDSVVLEGYEEDDRMYVREMAFNVLYVLNKNNLKTIYIHTIPLIPPHSRFVSLILPNSSAIQTRV